MALPRGGAALCDDVQRHRALQRDAAYAPACAQRAAARLTRGARAAPALARLLALAGAEQGSSTYQQYYCKLLAVLATYGNGQICRVFPLVF